MTYTPSEREKRATVAIQSLAAVFFFIPPLIAWGLQRFKTSPYIRYWTKVCLIWSLLSTILIVAGSVAAMLLEIAVPAILLFIVHFVFCIVGGLSSYFNTPFRYWFIANRFCRAELGDVYGQLVARSHATEK